MKQSYQDARKYYVAQFNLPENTPFEDVARTVVEHSNGKILFDVSGKQSAGAFLARLRLKEKFGY